jgi:hypothetical protein
MTRTSVCAGAPFDEPAVAPCELASALSRSTPKAALKMIGIQESHTSLDLATHLYRAVRIATRSRPLLATGSWLYTSVQPPAWPSTQAPRYTSSSHKIGLERCQSQVWGVLMPAPTLSIRMAWHFTGTSMLSQRRQCLLQAARSIHPDKLHIPEAAQAFQGALAHRSLCLASLLLAVIAARSRVTIGVQTLAATAMHELYPVAFVEHAWCRSKTLNGCAVLSEAFAELKEALAAQQPTAGTHATPTHAPEAHTWGAYVGAASDVPRPQSTEARCRHSAASRQPNSATWACAPPVAAARGSILKGARPHAGRHSASAEVPETAPNTKGGAQAPGLGEKQHGPAVAAMDSCQKDSVREQQQQQQPVELLDSPIASQPQQHCPRSPGLSAHQRRMVLVSDSSSSERSSSPDEAAPCAVRKRSRHSPQCQVAADMQQQEPGSRSHGLRPEASAQLSQELQPAQPRVSVLAGLVQRDTAGANYNALPSGGPAPDAAQAWLGPSQGAQRDVASPPLMLHRAAKLRRQAQHDSCAGCSSDAQANTATDDLQAPLHDHKTARGVDAHRHSMAGRADDAWMQPLSFASWQVVPETQSQTHSDPKGGQTQSQAAQPCSPDVRSQAVTGSPIAGSPCMAAQERLQHAQAASSDGVYADSPGHDPLASDCEGGYESDCSSQQEPDAANSAAPEAAATATVGLQSVLCGADSDSRAESRMEQHHDHANGDLSACAAEQVGTPAARMPTSTASTATDHLTSSARHAQHDTATDKQQDKHQPEYGQPQPAARGVASLARQRARRPIVQLQDCTSSDDSLGGHDEPGASAARQVEPDFAVAMHVCNAVLGAQSASTPEWGRAEWAAPHDKPSKATKQHPVMRTHAAGARRLPLDLAVRSASPRMPQHTPRAVPTAGAPSLGPAPDAAARCGLQQACTGDVGAGGTPAAATPAHSVEQRYGKRSRKHTRASVLLIQDFAKRANLTGAAAGSDADQPAATGAGASASGALCSGDDSVADPSQGVPEAGAVIGLRTASGDAAGAAAGSAEEEEDAIEDLPVRCPTSSASCGRILCVPSVA